MRAEAAAGYWATRRDFAYYREVVHLARGHAPAGGAVLDVGANETEVLERLDWFGRRVAVDVREIPSRPGVEAIVADFEEFEPDAPFDLVLCLQVLEHIPDPAPFARRLLDCARIAIVSVPYRWPGWVTDEHLHDPVDAAKLRRWTARDPIAAKVVEDLGMERLISVYGESATRST
ncbi:MAG: class I SAM-dependent methyltransferase [Solirubrobacterales bacterium]